MILKEADNRSEDIAELKRLKETSPASFRATIQKQIENIYAGFTGERSAAHFINRAYRASEKTAVLHDLRIEHEGEFAQIDHLVIHRFWGAAWVLETKSYSGRLTCDEHGDWTVWYGRKAQPVPSPINQARRQCNLLRLWMDAKGIKAVRNIHPVVLISPTSSVDRRMLADGDHIVKADNFDEWFDKQAESPGVGTALGMFGRHILNGLSVEDLKALGEQIAAAHVPPSYDWRAMLRLPCSSEPADPCDAQPVRQDAPVRDADESAKEGPQVISTPHGDIRISRIPDGRYALRNDKDEALIGIVKNACKGKAQWNPRFRNWLISEEKLPDILATIQSS